MVTRNKRIIIQKIQLDDPQLYTIIEDPQLYTIIEDPQLYTIIEDPQLYTIIEDPQLYTIIVNNAISQTLVIIVNLRVLSFH